MSGEATLRAVRHEDGTYVHAADVAAFLLDCAQAAEEHPTMRADGALRSLAAALSAYEARQP